MWGLVWCGGVVEWWERNLDGRIHSVRIAHADGVMVPRWRHARWCFELE